MQCLLPYLPWIIVGLSIIGIILLIILAVMLIRSIRSAARARAARRSALKQSSSGSRFGFINWTREKLKHGWFYFREQYTEGPKDEIAASFKKTLEVLHNYVDGKDSQYQMPWFMVIGCENSGKTSLIDGSELELPIGRPEYEGFPETTKINWTFFDGAVVADIKGTLLLNETDFASQEKQWDYVLNLFKYYRPKRPLDGIILTIPADELIGPNQHTNEDILHRAKVIYTKLWRLQSTLGMRVPVYVIVTKSDKIPGFASLVSQIPPENRQEMFGWSSPYELKTGFSDDWIHDIFRSIHNALVQVRSSIFTREVEEENRSGNVLAPIEFSALKDPLGLYLAQIFKDSSYHDSFFLRGVYFCGYGDTEEGGKFNPSAIVTEGETQQRKSMIENRFVFVRDLFEKKIFKEFSLGEPISRLLVSTHRTLNYIKIASFVVAAIWAIGLYKENVNFQARNQSILPALKTINTAIQGVNAMGGVSNNPKIAKYLNSQSDEILNQFTNIESVDVTSIFIPSSWFTVLDEKIQRCFTAAYDKIILPSLVFALTNKIEDLTTKANIALAPQGILQSYPNPVYLPSFIALQQYVDGIKDLEKAADAYNNLGKTRSVSDLGMLIKYLFNKTLPDNFYKNTRYYQEALGRSNEQKIDLFSYRNAAIDKLVIYYREFLNNAFNIDTNLQALVQLQKALDTLAQYTSYKKMDEQDLRNVVEKAIAFADLISSGEMTWVGKQLFDPGAKYNDLMDNIAGSKMLGNEIASELGRTADLAFAQFRVNLASRKTALTGTLFTVKDGVLIADPSPGLVIFIDSSTAFLNELFMARANRLEIQYKIPPGKMLFWDEAILQKATKIIDDFKEFQTQRLIKFPNLFQNIFKEIGRNSVRKKVVNSVAQAENFLNEPLGFSSFGMREMLIAQVQNIAVVSPTFASILGVFNDGGFVVENSKLRELLVQQNYDILTKIDNLLLSDNLYSANEEQLTWWNGEPFIAFKLFGVRDGNEMKEYLTTQRLRITFLAKEMAAPILNLLSYGYIENIPIDLPLVTKWSRILTAVDAYNNKNPGNSIRMLETFLLDDLNKISLQNCLSSACSFDKFPESSDYFLEIRNHLYNLVERRCENIGLKDAIQVFNEAAAFFNANLAGRFPFTKTVDTSCALEADPEDVSTFFKIFDGLNPIQLEMLKMSCKNQAADCSVGLFIKEIESIRLLMLAALNSGESQSVAKINLTAVFRSDRDREIGGENIIDWSIQSGGSRLGMRGNCMKVDWSVGVPIDVYIKWASNGETVPMPDPRLVSLNVSGPVATFSYSGRWALIRLLREHAMPESLFDAQFKPRAQLLEFTIPTVFNPNCFRGVAVLPIERTSPPVRLYMRLALQVPLKAIQQSGEATAKAEKGKEPAAKEQKILAVPHFPFKAPLYQCKGD
jgi:type VI secretion system protein ImpL